MLFKSLAGKISPAYRPALRNEVLRFASAHQRLQKSQISSEPEDIEKLRSVAAESAAKLKNQPFYLNSQQISLIASNPSPWIDEIYDEL
jgi:hypothetical protein